MDKKFETPKPVAVGDTINVKIESQGGNGDGIAKVDGFVIFVKGAHKNEQCRIKITEIKRTFALGEKCSSRDKEMEQEMDDEVEGSKSGPLG